MQCQPGHLLCPCQGRQHSRRLHTAAGRCIINISFVVVSGVGDSKVGSEDNGGSYCSLFRSCQDTCACGRRALILCVRARAHVCVCVFSCVRAHTLRCVCSNRISSSSSTSSSSMAAIQQSISLDSEILSIERVVCVCVRVCMCVCVCVRVRARVCV